VTRGCNDYDRRDQRAASSTAEWQCGWIDRDEAAHVVIGNAPAHKSADRRRRRRCEQDSCYERAVDREQAAREIAREGAKLRARVPRSTWIAALAIAALCAGALAIGWAIAPSRKPDAAPSVSHESTSTGFALGGLVGLGAGIAIGYGIARRRSR
jgi:hypothetical protein